MSAPVKIAILDDDHVTRLICFALTGAREVTERWVRDYFSPEEVEPAELYAAGAGLHPKDGVELLPLAAGFDQRKNSEADIVIFRRSIVDAHAIAAHPRLKFIQRIGARSDGIDVPAAAARNIVVSCWPRPSQQYSAEHAILLMLALSKRLVEADTIVRSGKWDRETVHPQDGVAYNWTAFPDLGGLFGSTVGIIGMGEIGSMVAKIAGGFGARVIYTNRRRLSLPQEEQFGAEGVPLDRLLAESDFVSVHAQNLPENREMIGAPTFAQMKRTAFFINTSRGRMVDERALHHALTTGIIAGAGLDVHFDEPRSAPDAISRLTNVILTPHLAGGSRRGVLAEVIGLLANCRSMVEGRAIQHRVLA